MGDSWEDEEFEVPTFVAPAIPRANWEDEEDEVEIDPKVVVTKPSQSQIDAEKKRAEEAEKTLATKLKLAQLANETPEEKRLREKKQAEEADNELTGELFGANGKESPGGASLGSSSKGIGSIVLKTKQDHLTFGSTIAQKLSSSSAFNVAAFYKTLSKSLDTPSMTAEVLDDILVEITKIRDAKAKAEKPTKQGAGKKSKKDIKAAEQKHNAVFGGSDFVDQYDDQYGNMEDDFM